MSNHIQEPVETQRQVLPYRDGIMRSAHRIATIRHGSWYASNVSDQHRSIVTLRTSTLCTIVQCRVSYYDSCRSMSTGRGVRTNSNHSFIALRQTRGVKKRHDEGRGGKEKQHMHPNRCKPCTTPCKTKGVSQDDECFT